MKNIYVIISLILIFFMLLLPLLSLKGEESTEKEENAVITFGGLEDESAQVSVLMSDTQKIEKMDINDYIFGVVAAEMPALYEKEALKAQAVAAYTYALHRAQQNSDKPYDITDSPATDQCYISKEKAQEKWGENAAEYEEKIKGAISEVEGEYIAYNKKPILALYHAISGGKTESCKAVFGQDLPYLTVCDSIGDLTAKGYLQTVEFTAAELKEKLANKVSLSSDEGEWIGEIKHRDNGYTESIKICGKSLTGTELRAALSLRSANFDAEYKNGKFVFTTRGYGHGVGMSQAGAQHLAKQGGTYKEILLWYYKDCEIVKN